MKENIKKRGQLLLYMNIPYFHILEEQKPFKIHFLCNKCNVSITKYTSL